MKQGKKPEPSERAEEIRSLPLSAVRENPDQPRRFFDQQSIKELAISIKEQGVLQPIIVQRSSDEDNKDTYLVIVGGRRVRAARKAKLRSIPAIVREASATQALELAYIENVQRADLSAIEEAEALKELLKKSGLSQTQLGKKVGKSQAAIANSIRLLKLPKPIQDAVAAGKISATAGRALLSISDLEQQKQLAQAILMGELESRELENLGQAPKRGGKKPEAKNTTVEEYEQKLEGAIGTRVIVKHWGRKQRFEIYFGSPEEMERIASWLLEKE